jgi:ATP-dependent helicase HrpA
MLLRASELGCLHEMLVIVSVLSVQDPRDLSTENRQAANEKFKQWQDKQSDFAGWLNLWAEINRQKQELSRNRFAKWCKKQYLSWLRVREWQDIYQQIRTQARELKLYFNSAEADLDLVHRAILSGIPSHIAYRDPEGIYKTTRDRETVIFPGSALAKKTPKWIMAFSLIDTGRLYAHTVAVMNPHWAITDLQHLHQYEYYEPHWQEKQGRVGAYRNTRISGVLIETGKRVNYARVNRKASREIFIREALVEGRYRTSVEFIKANRKLIEHYRGQEERERRRDLLIGEEQIYDFYDQRLPDTIVDAVSFESWVKTLDAGTIKSLTLFEQDILAQEHQHDAVTYPEYLQVKNQTLRLQYVFDPADDADGVTVFIPLAVLNQFDDADFDFLVPGLLQDKVQALLRSLPKQLRKNFIPVPDFARACTEALEPGKPFYEQLSRQLQRMTGVSVALDQWRPDRIDRHFLMRYCLQEDGVDIASSRSLQQLKDEYSDKANLRFEQQVQHDDSISRQGIHSWDFDRLPESVEIKRNGNVITAFPSLVDYHDSVAIELFETRDAARLHHASGIARLIAFELRDSIKYLRKNLPKIDQSALLYIKIGSKQELIEDIIMASIFACFLSERLPEQSAEFDAIIAKNKPEFIVTANRIAELIHNILKLHREVSERLSEVPLSDDHLADCREQCDHLVYAGFVYDIEPAQLLRLPAYFQALLKRIEKSIEHSGQADRSLPLIRELWQRYLELEQQTEATEKLEQLRWMIEEFRISCFAQPMKTQGPVSEKRIRKLIAEIESSAPVTRI